MKKIIVWGAGRNGYDSYKYFGGSNIAYYIDNNPREKTIFDKDIITLDEFRKLFQKDSDFNEKYEVVISVSISIWATFSIATQLRQLGIENYSVYLDVKKRWKTGNEFIKRNLDIYKCEQESIMEIYKIQRDYLMRHVEANDLLPATGKLREVQNNVINRVNKFFEFLQSENDAIKPFMIKGTILGAYRHQGFIPWDDDMDFGLLYNQYIDMLNILNSKNGVFYFRGDDVWTNNKNDFPSLNNGKYIVALGLGYAQIYENIGKAYIKDNKFITDIMPFYFFSEEYTCERYNSDLKYWILERNKNFTEVDDKYLNESIKNGIISLKNTTQIGLGHDWTSFISIMIGAHGRKFDNQLWDVDKLLPLKKMKFENYEFYAPNDEVAWLKQEGYDDFSRLPSRVGVWVHEKDRFFTEEY